MKMKRVGIVVLLAACLAFAGCNQGTSGGPGAATPPEKERMGQTEDTFSLSLPSVSINQGGTAVTTAEISRGKNFSEDVTLELDGLPTGVTFAPEAPVINRGDTDTELTFYASDDAALGDFTVKVSGHPTKGADAMTELKMVVAIKEVVDTASTDTPTDRWNAFTAAMQNQMEHFTVMFASLQESAAKAEGQAKEELDLKVAQAKIKMEEASVKLDELKAAGAEHWESVKDGVASAFESLKATLG